VDVAPDEQLLRAVRNLPGVSARPASGVTAREVVAAARVVTTRGALERLQDALA
jgi:hypothetical protein